MLYMGCISMLRMSKLLVVLCVAFAFLISSPTANATTLGFRTQSLSPAEKTDAIEDINLELVFDSSNKAGIQCFDVSSNGSVALAFQEDSKGWIYVYNADGTFQYGFTFAANGDYGVEFYQDFLALYFLRGNRIAIYDSSGTCIDILDEIPPNQNIGRTKEILNRSQKESSGKQYILERDVALGDSYSRCVVIDQQGVQTVIYDISTKHRAGQIVRLISILCFFAFGSWAAIRKYIKKEDE